MYYFLFFILGFLAGAGVVWAVSKRSPSTSSGSIINNAQVERRQENLQKVLELIRAKGQADNAAVQSSLGVSDATAVRYMDELEQQGKIEQVGKTGQGVYYRLK